MSGQSIMDRVTAAKHSLSGQGLAKVVCKATTEEVMGPKKKHLDYLIQCTNEPNVSIPQLADLLIERTQHTNWTIVFKSLITIHNLMNYGNERFTQYLASNNCTFNLSGFIDKAGVQGYDMSTYIRRYSKYLNEKAVSYRSMAFDFCKIRRGKDDGVLRKMNAEKLLKTLPSLQRQLDALLEFDCTPNELTNGVMNACFLLLFKDLIRLFACYNDGVINLLEKYFDMNKKQCKDGLECYKRFLVRMDKVGEFLKVAENVGIDKGDIPDLAKAPSSLLDALEQHLASLEGKKGVAASTKPAGFSSAVNSISSNSSIQISDEEKKKILDEENIRLQQLKEQSQTDLFTTDDQEQKLKEKGATTVPNTISQPATQSTNPFASSAPQTNNLLGSPTGAPPSSASDDLLSLTGNPFVQNVQQVMAMNNSVNHMQQYSAGGWNSQPTNQGFGREVDFSKAFQNNTSPAALTVNTSFGMLPTPIAPSPSEAADGSEKELSLLDPLDPLAPSPQTGMYSTSAPASSTLDNMFGGTTGASGGSAIFGSPIKQGTSLDIFGASPVVTSSSAGKGTSTDVFGVPSFVTSSTTGKGTSSDIFGVPSVVTSSSADMFSNTSGISVTGGNMSMLIGSPQHASSDVDYPGTGMATADSAIRRSSPAPGGSEEGSGFDAFGEVLKPANKQGQPQTAQADKLLQKDLDSSLASLAGNLNINPAASVKKTQHEWQPKGEQKKTGGANFQFQGNAASSTWTTPQYNQPMMSAPAASPNRMYQQPMGQPMQMMQPGMMGQRPMGMGMGMQPMMGGQPQPGMYGMQPMGGPMMSQPRPPAQQSMNDPFGAL